MDDTIIYCPVTDNILSMFSPLGFDCFMHSHLPIILDHDSGDWFIHSPNGSTYSATSTNIEFIERTRVWQSLALIPA